MAQRGLIKAGAQKPARQTAGAWAQKKVRELGGQIGGDAARLRAFDRRFKEAGIALFPGAERLAGDRAQDRARRDSVYGDPEMTKFGREGFDQMNQGGFGSAVARDVGKISSAPDPGSAEDDDGARPALSSVMALEKA